jgi:hypothetical protein
VPVFIFIINVRHSRAQIVTLYHFRRRTLRAVFIFIVHVRHSRTKLLLCITLGSLRCSGTCAVLIFSFPGCPGLSPWLFLACSWLLLGCSWLLMAAPGCLWLLLAASGCSAAPGCLWLLLMSTVEPKKTTCLGSPLGSCRGCASNSSFVLTSLLVVALVWRLVTTFRCCKYECGR